MWLILCAVRGSVSARNPIEPMMMIADEAEEKKKRKKKLGEFWFLGNGAGIPSIPSSFFSPLARMLDASRLDDSI